MFENKTRKWRLGILWNGSKNLGFTFCLPISKVAELSWRRRREGGKGSSVPDSLTDYFQFCPAFFFNPLFPSPDSFLGFNS